MRNHHVTHLLTRYAHGQLRPPQRAQVINHVRTCARCREALAREERLAADLRREMPLIGQAGSGQLSRVWAGVWQEIDTPRRRSRLGGSTWLPGLSAVLAVLLLVVVAVPLVIQSDLRAEAAPQQPRPDMISLASPTPGMTDEAPRDSALLTLPGGEPEQPPATFAAVIEAGASPVPEPQSTVSPIARVGWR